MLGTHRVPEGLSGRFRPCPSPIGNYVGDYYRSRSQSDDGFALARMAKNRCHGRASELEERKKPSRQLLRRVLSLVFTEHSSEPESKDLVDRSEQ
jgi:hypothetical protein